MDDDPRDRLSDPPAVRPETDGGRALDIGLLMAVGVIALLTLMPAGRGWEWGAPLSELHWYATGWTSQTAMLQLFGNLALLSPLAALAVVRWPDVARPRRLVPAAVGVATAIELLQWVLPLGRVVSPVDALLNATGAVLTGLVLAAVRTVRAAGCAPRPARRPRTPAPARPSPLPRPAP